MRFPLLAKLLSLGVVLLLIGMVLARIGYLVDERGGRQQEAVRSVEQSHVGAQALLGPWVERKCTEEWEEVTGTGKDRKTSIEKREMSLLATADRLDAAGQVQSDVRHRGLLRVNSYVLALDVDARWTSLASLQPQREHVGSRLSCGAAQVVLAISDVRGVREAKLEVDGQALPVQPGTLSARYQRGLRAELPAARVLPGEAVPLAVRLSLKLAGTGQLSLVPAAAATEWRLRSDWPHPSFSGRFLPIQHEERPQGFSAQWQVSSLASSAAADLARGLILCDTVQRADGDGGVAGTATAACLDTLSVAFFDPVNPYVLSDRAIKYGLLFVVLTFAAVLLVEALSGRRVHPVQYALVGLALSLFFLLLLSLSEHLPFEQAYGAAAAGCALLLGYYGAHMLGRTLAGLAFGAGIGLLYGLLYLLLQMEQNALVVGSLALFVVLAGVMVLTRRVDWYQLFDSWRRSAVAAPSAAPLSR